MFAPWRSVDRKTIEHPRAAGRDQVCLTASLARMRHVPRRVAAADAVRKTDLRRALTAACPIVARVIGIVRIRTVICLRVRQPLVSTRLPYTTLFAATSP